MGVDHDSADVPRRGQASVLPVLPAVDRAQHADPRKGRAAAAGVHFARADPEHSRIRGVQGDRADREARGVIEERAPGTTVVGGLEHAAVGGRDVVEIGVARVNREIGDAASDVGWADQLPAPQVGRGFERQGLCLRRRAQTGAGIDLPIRIGALQELEGDLHAGVAPASGMGSPAETSAPAPRQVIVDRGGTTRPGTGDCRSRRHYPPRDRLEGMAVRYLPRDR